MKNILMLLLIGMNFIACASQEELEERRQNAFDVTGTYTSTTKAGSSLDFVVQIQNESGRHDIVASLERNSVLTTGERNFLQNEEKLDADRVANHFGKKLILGRGKSKSLEGGDNISDNFGVSSRIHICTESMNYDPATKVAFCLSGSIRKDDYVLRGSLYLNVQKETVEKDKDGKDYRSIKASGHASNFAASTENVYFTQYFGTWTGEVQLNENNTSTNINTLSLFTLQRVSETSYQVLSSMNQINLNGVRYDFEAQTWPVAKLSDSAIPLIEMSFRNPSGDRIVYYGQIRSLGNLTGAVVHITATGRTQIGSFLSKKR